MHTCTLIVPMYVVHQSLTATTQQVRCTGFFFTGVVLCGWVEQLILRSTVHARIEVNLVTQVRDTWIISHCWFTVVVMVHGSLLRIGDLCHSSSWPVVTAPTEVTVPTCAPKFYSLFFKEWQRWLYAIDVYKAWNIIKQQCKSYQL